MTLDDYIHAEGADNAFDVTGPCIISLDQSLRDTIHADTKARGESRRVMDAQTAEIERLREQVRVLQEQARASKYHQPHRAHSYVSGVARTSMSSAAGSVVEPRGRLVLPRNPYRRNEMEIKVFSEQDSKATLLAEVHRLKNLVSSAPTEPGAPLTDAEWRYIAAYIQLCTPAIESRINDVLARRNVRTEAPADGPCSVCSDGGQEYCKRHGPKQQAPAPVDAELAQRCLSLEDGNPHGAFAEMAPCLCETDCRKKRRVMS